MHLQDHIEDLAKEMAGNWNDPEGFGNFVYHDPPWEPEDEETEGPKWCLAYTSSRDSGLMAQSNEAVVERELAEFLSGPDINRIRHSHWGVGYLDGFEIRVYDSKGKITPVFAKFAELKLALADYPVLDDSDYSEREYDAAVEAICNNGSQFVRDDAPDDWDKQVYSWLWDNDQEALKNVDDQGPYPSEEQIKSAVKALGFLSKEYEDE
jgi:hypothetical protein